MCECVSVCVSECECERTFRRQGDTSSSVLNLTEARRCHSPGLSNVGASYHVLSNVGSFQGSRCECVSE